MASDSGFLLDTNAFIWAGTASHRLSSPARRALSDPTSILHVSTCSVWEMQIKHALGKLPLPENADQVARLFLSSLLARLLPVRIDHIAALYELPAVHRDPFDRMLVAQAQTEGLTIVSADPVFTAYAVPVLW